MKIFCSSPGTIKNSIITRGGSAEVTKSKKKSSSRALTNASQTMLARELCDTGRLTPRAQKGAKTDIKGAWVGKGEKKMRETATLRDYTGAGNKGVCFRPFMKFSRLL